MRMRPALLLQVVFTFMCCTASTRAQGLCLCVVGVTPCSLSGSVALGGVVPCEPDGEEQRAGLVAVRLTDKDPAEMYSSLIIYSASRYALLSPVCLKKRTLPYDQSLVRGAHGESVTSLAGMPNTTPTPIVLCSEQRGRQQPAARH